MKFLVLGFVCSTCKAYDNETLKLLIICINISNGH